MAGRIRSLKPEIIENARTAALSSEAFRLFIGCIAQADDYGNFIAEPKKLEGAVFWACDPRESVQALLEILARVSLVKLYAVDGRRFGHLIGWFEHQKVDHPGKPKVPGPETADPPSPRGVGVSRETLANDSRDPRETLAPDGMGWDGMGSISLTGGSPASKFDFAALYALYPRKVGKTKGLAQCHRQIKTAADFESLRLAIETYRAAVAGKSSEYVKHFSTFMGCWRDYLEAPTEPDAIPQRQLDPEYLARVLAEDPLSGIPDDPEENHVAGGSL